MKFLKELLSKDQENLIVTTSNMTKISFLTGMSEGLCVLRMLFYGNLLGGERDTLEIREEERENDKKMEVEFINRRQRHPDDGNDDNNYGERDFQQSEQQDEYRQDAATHSPQLARARNFLMRRSISEEDEIDWIYENPLQTQLGLEPNEYRRGHLPFEDFVNEYANEKIEINKEYLDVFRRSNTPNFSFILYSFFLTTMNKIGN